MTPTNTEALASQQTKEQTMNIDNLTFGELKQIAALFSSATSAPQPHPLQGGIASSLIGKYVIARCYSAGVHAGTIEAVDGENVILRDSRRLWSWRAADGMALSGLAQHGLKSGKLDTLNPRIYLTGVCELIPVAAGVQESIDASQ